MLLSSYMHWNGMESIQVGEDENLAQRPWIELQSPVFTRLNVPSFLHARVRVRVNANTSTRLFLHD
jgi:hypothetical protein